MIIHNCLPVPCVILTFTTMQMKFRKYFHHSLPDSMQSESLKSDSRAVTVA